jgi:hypothetical protein
MATQLPARKSNSVVRKGVPSSWKDYETLPPGLRDWLQNAAFNYSSSQVLKAWKRLGCDIRATRQLLDNLQHNQLQEFECYRTVQVPGANKIPVQALPSQQPTAKSLIAGGSPEECGL